MTNNGVVQPDLRWKPVAYELKQVYAPVWLEKEFSTNSWATVFNRSRLVLKNRSFTQRTSDFEAKTCLRKNGIIYDERKFDLPDIGPGEQCCVDFDVPHEVESGFIYHLDVALMRKKPLWYEDRDHVDGMDYEVYHAQFEQEAALPPADIPVLIDKLIVTDDREISVKATYFEVMFDKTTGRMKNCKANGTVIIEEGGEPRFDRPRTGLDCQPGWGWHSETSVFDETVTTVNSYSLTQSEIAAVISFELSIETKRKEYPLIGRITYTVTGAGVKVGYFCRIPGAYELVSRVGLRFILSPGFVNLTYLGYGPNECYSDRMESVYYALHSSTAEEQHFPFIPPSECGGHEKTEMVSLTNGNKTVKFIGDAPFHFDVHHNTTEDYRRAKYEHELIRRKEIIFHIDAVHAPIGSKMSWSTGLDRDKTPGAGSYYLGFEICV